MKFKSLISVLFLIIFLTVNGQDLHDYIDGVDNFFMTHVKDGRVNYQGIKKNPGELEKLVNSAKSISVTISNPNEYQAFWINTYNIMVIKGVVENYPIKTPLDIPGFFDSIEYQVGGKSLTLNEIENDVLRANFPKEPRFHFVLVCAGLGCPPIIPEAYKPSELDNQLQIQTEKSLNNPDFIKVKNDEVEVSQIFEWYQEDFTHEGKSIKDFINGYRKDKISLNSKLSYYPYNWKLNELK
ncbi:DUF547 domain-containing protein [Maribacter sp. PR1]|uniref:DUF547 domain-containing protein n=1 Tax=Maribacter cobaltidurans TaxID=1178778 RepID=A0ABU7IUC6_9FLAO|nr:MULTISPECIES: DUF547 domain-containing protein [Maribacter]MDC6389197.1 DUF547 domain-containing protein [Maribacter sp. PR1]MEE1976584.1 DUF547 domain-containing protein [Maribacter cobaltidurans]